MANEKIKRQKNYAFMVKGLKLALVAIIALASWVVYATTPQPDWVFGIAWFTWDPSIAKKGQTVNWYGGVYGVGTFFELKVQINRPSDIKINYWDYQINAGPSIAGVCKVVYQGIVYEDGNNWHTWRTDNLGSLIIFPRHICALVGAGYFSVSVFGTATPIAIGDFIGRSIGGVSGIFYYAQSILKVS